MQADGKLTYPGVRGASARGLLLSRATKHEQVGLNAHLRAGRRVPRAHGTQRPRGEGGGPDWEALQGLRSGLHKGMPQFLQKVSQMPSHCRLQATWFLSQPWSFSLPCRVVQNFSCDVVWYTHTLILGFMLLEMLSSSPTSLPFALLIPPHSIRLSLRVTFSKKLSPNSFPRLALAPLLVTLNIFCVCLHQA